MNDKLEKMWKEVVKVSLKILTHHLRERLWKARRKTSAAFMAKIQTR